MFYEMFYEMRLRAVYSWASPCIVKQFSAENFQSRQNGSQKWRFFANIWIWTLDFIFKTPKRHILFCVMVSMGPRLWARGRTKKRTKNKKQKNEHFWDNLSPTRSVIDSTIFVVILYYYCYCYCHCCCSSTAHAPYHVIYKYHIKGPTGNHIFGIQLESTLTIHYLTFTGLRWRLRAVYSWASPLLSALPALRMRHITTYK